MSDSRPVGEANETEALTDETEVHEASSPDDERPAAEPTMDSGIDAEREVDLGDGAPEASSEATSDDDVDDTDATGQPVEDAGTGTGDASDQAELDAPD